jgi:hypothetical protein
VDQNQSFWLQLGISKPGLESIANRDQRSTR